MTSFMRMCSQCCQWLLMQQLHPCRHLNAVFKYDELNFRAISVDQAIFYLTHLLDLRLSLQIALSDADAAARARALRAEKERARQAARPADVRAAANAKKAAARAAKKAALEELAAGPLAAAARADDAAAAAADADAAAADVGADAAPNADAAMPDAGAAAGGAAAAPYTRFLPDDLPADVVLSIADLSFPSGDREPERARYVASCLGYVHYNGSANLTAASALFAKLQRSHKHVLRIVLSKQPWRPDEYISAASYRLKRVFRLFDIETLTMHARQCECCSKVAVTPGVLLGDRCKEFHKFAIASDKQGKRMYRVDGVYKVEVQAKAPPHWQDKMLRHVCQSCYGDVTNKKSLSMHIAA